MTTVSPPLPLHSWQGQRILALYMQRVLGYSPVVAGAVYLPLTFGVGIAAGIGAKLATKVGSRAVICVGALIAATGLFLLGHVPVGGGYPAHILPGLLLVAVGSERCSSE
jgi:fucose permease